ncbi:hypothetical protein ACFFP0_31710 [Rhizobium puerariae]|uniref:Uncharacterized protein n=1 Tax=Rhizobium puerariae TaxID=1585791 RepID=A0ABV6AUM7_9HYPH
MTEAELIAARAATGMRPKLGHGGIVCGDVRRIFGALRCSDDKAFIVRLGENNHFVAARRGDDLRFHDSPHGIFPPSAGGRGKIQAPWWLIKRKN